MKAAVVYEYGKPIEVVELRLGSLADNDVLVRIEASGLCHSDVAVQEGGLPFPTPNIVGHEGAGVVEEVGRGVTTVKPGDHVVLSALMSCGLCAYCQKGRPNLCAWGLPTIFGCKHPDGDFRACDGHGPRPLPVRLHRHAREQDDRARDLGREDPRGRALRGRGARRLRRRHRARRRVPPREGRAGSDVRRDRRRRRRPQRDPGLHARGRDDGVAIDPVASKRDLASDFGATHSSTRPRRTWSSGSSSSPAASGADYVFECVGKGPLFRQAWDACGVDGTVLAIGVASHDDVTELPSQAFSTSEKTLMSCLYGTSRPRMDMPLYIEMYRQGRLKLDELVTRATRSSR